ncbi:MAG: ADP-ribosylglycohydrolase family protein [Erysipelotrichaceae bacterium]|nr:ADP-ribosylglycohydrolase family protein [Erysipelotrichaceae bacterium]
MTNLNKVFKSVLFAIAYGDAFGMPSEMMSYNEIKARIGYIDQFLPSQENIYFNRSLKAGTVTDDTIFSLILTEVILENNGVISTTSFVDKMIDLLNSNKIDKTVIGPSTLKAFTSISDGVLIEAAGIFGTTNGAAMKIAPISLINIYSDEDKLIDDVYKICLPTHNTRVAISGAITIAYIIYAFIRNDIDWNTLWSNVYRILDKSKDLGVNTSHSLLESRIKMVENLLRSPLTIDEKIIFIQNDIGTSMDTLETIPSAIALAYLANGDLRACARLCANIGGDTDTIGAIACAILNAKEHLILDEELAFIQTVNNLDFDDISERLANCVIQRSSST